MAIRSDDVNAIELLKARVASLEEERDRMKRVNAYYRKNNTLDGCVDLSDAERRGIEDYWERGWYTGRPYPPYTLQNLGANIKRLKGRIESLEMEKLARECQDLRGDTGEVEGDGYVLRENRELNRIQFLFDEKPEAAVRVILKKHGFHWAPSEGAWQRMLNETGRRYARYVMDAIRSQDIIKGEAWSA